MLAHLVECSGVVVVVVVIVVVGGGGGGGGAGAGGAVAAAAVVVVVGGGGDGVVFTFNRFASQRHTQHTVSVPMIPPLVLGGYKFRSHNARRHPVSAVCRDRYLVYITDTRYSRADRC